MVCPGNRGEGAGIGMVRKSGNMNQKLVERSTFHALPADSEVMWWDHIIHHSGNLNSGWPEIERPQCFWMYMIIQRYAIFTVIYNYTIRRIQLSRVWWGSGSLECERQPSAADFKSYPFRNQRTALSQSSKFTVFVGIIAKTARNMLFTPSKKWASTECQRFLAFHHG